MSATLEYCFDYASPYSYFAHTQLPAVLERTGAQVTYTPVLLGGIFKATGNQTPIAEPCVPKRTYNMKTLQRWIAHYAVPFQMNPAFPINTVNVMRAATAAQREGVFEAFHAAMFPAMWVEGRNLGEPSEIASVATAAGVDGDKLVALSQEQDVKDALRANTERVIELGAFGVPTFLVGDELFWGADHLHFVESALRAQG